MDITLAQAEAVMAAAKEKATEINTQMDICVVDAGANLVAFARVDGVWLGSVDIAFKKSKNCRLAYNGHGRAFAVGAAQGPAFQH